MLESILIGDWIMHTRLLIVFLTVFTASFSMSSAVAHPSGLATFQNGGNNANADAACRAKGFARALDFVPLHYIGGQPYVWLALCAES